MMLLWRISAHGELSGLGGEKWHGRWHTAAPGKRIVYLSEHPAVALLETLVNLKGDPQFFPRKFRLMKLNVRGDVSANSLAPKLLSENWHEEIDETRSLGDAWLASGESALLAVPAAPAPESLNYLFNPLHSEAKGVAIEWHKAIAYDQRLFHFHLPKHPQI